MAEYYDEIFAPFRTPIDAARRRILGAILPQVEVACDLACGTGVTALALARHSTKVYALDLSPSMCRITKQKAKAAGAPVRVRQADMRAFRLPEPVDLVTCEGDALNHIPRKADLRAVARSVYRALRPGGCFFFDVNNSAGFKRYWSGTFWHEKPGVVVVMRNHHSPQADKAWSDIDWFIQSGNSWRRHSEKIQEVCWPAGQVQDTFQAAGFDPLEAFDAAPFFKTNTLITPGCRTFYVARKPAREDTSRPRR